MSAQFAVAQTVFRLVSLSNIAKALVFPVTVVEDVGGLGTPVRMPKAMWNPSIPHSQTVAAHEMSHSLGAFHDGFGESENCSVRQNFLMAPISAAHPFDPLFGDTFANGKSLKFGQLFNVCSIPAECLLQEPDRRIPQVPIRITHSFLLPLQLFRFQLPLVVRCKSIISLGRYFRRR